MLTSLRRPVAGLVALVLAAACGGAGSGPSDQAQVTFNLSTAPDPALPGLARLSDTLVAGTDSLVLDSVQLVLRDVRFKRVEDDACDDDHDDGPGDDRGDDSTSMPRAAGRHGDGGGDGCGSYNAGPHLLDLPLGGGVSRGFTVAVDTGAYDELRLKIHKPRSDGGDPRDVDFLVRHPAFAGVSIRAVGRFNGAPFTWTTDLDAKQELDFQPPLVVAAPLASVDVTIQVDLAGWFRDGQGGLVDPATAGEGGAHEQLVRDNIRASFRAFRDDDRDGHDDDDHHGGDDSGDDD